MTPAPRNLSGASLATPGPRAALDHPRALAAKSTVTLLTATKDTEHSQAAVLAALLQKTH